MRIQLQSLPEPLEIMFTLRYDYDSGDFSVTATCNIAIHNAFGAQGLTVRPKLLSWSSDTGLKFQGSAEFGGVEWHLSIQMTSEEQVHSFTRIHTRTSPSPDLDPNLRNWR